MARSCVVRASCANASARSANRLRVYLQTLLGSKGWFSRIIMRLTLAWGALPLPGWRRGCGWLGACGRRG
eukprot:scaffold13875_cov133-Isochrysis_galbana.AAC.1